VTRCGISWRARCARCARCVRCGVSWHPLTASITESRKASSGFLSVCLSVCLSISPLPSIDKYSSLFTRRSEVGYLWLLCLKVCDDAVYVCVLNVPRRISSGAVCCDELVCLSVCLFAQSRVQTSPGFHIKTMPYSQTLERNKMFSVFSWRQQYRFRLGGQRGERSMQTDQGMRTLSRQILYEDVVRRRMLSVDLFEAGSTMSARYILLCDVPLCMECISRPKHSLYCIRQRICSQCSWIRLAVVWSGEFKAPHC